MPAKVDPAGGGRRVQALTAEVGQHAAGSPLGTVPSQPTGDVVRVPTCPLPSPALCRERGVRGNGPAAPQPPVAPLHPTASPRACSGGRARQAARAGSRR